MRVGYNTKPYEKHMEVFQNFSGGLNTVSPPDGMLDTELTDMLNQDISERGSLKRRFGARLKKPLIAGYKQGYFRYYRTNGMYDDIYAIDGDLYLNGGLTPVLITGMNDAGGTKAFQNTRPVEAAQFGGILYIATGTKLAQYDGTNFSIVDWYTPNTMEMTYIGSNALADDPEAHLQDSTGSVASIDYILPKQTQQGSWFGIYTKIFCTKLVGETYEFNMTIRDISFKDQDWTGFAETGWHELTGNTSKTKLVSSPGEVEIRVQMRKLGTTEILSESVVSFKMTSTLETKVPTGGSIHTCNRVFTHWGRMMLYGDTSMPATLYMSHLNTPNYFPSLLNLEFDNPRRESLTTIVHYRNSLVAFTKSSTQALYGTGPDDYRRVMLHTDLGCIAPYGAAVMKNHIGFVSLQGIYALKTMGLTDDKATVEKLDIKIDNIVPKDSNVFTVFTDGQLQVTYPNTKQRFRFYSDLGAWTKDYSDKFDFAAMQNIDGVIHALGPLGIYAFDNTMYSDDDYVYENYWETKYLNFGQPYHQKKLKEVQILTNPKDEEMTCTVYVYADEQAVITPDESYASIVDGAVVWNTVIEQNFHVAGGSTFDQKWILGDSVLGRNVFSVNKLRLTGKCLRTRIRVSSNEPKENHFMGFAYVFKVKKA